MSYPERANSNIDYLLLAARLRLPWVPPPCVNYSGVTFSVEPEHYQLRSVIKSQAIQPVLARILSLCDEETLFLDVGANVGLFSLIVAAQAGSRVLAFEPVRSTFQALVRNCASNARLDVTPLNLALGACTDLVEITAIPGSGINHVVPEGNHLGDRCQWAPQLALDQLCVERIMGDRRMLVIKIDVERYEFEVLKGAHQLLSLDLPIAICVEVPAEERLRLQDDLGSRFHVFSPPCSMRLPLQEDHDSSDLFYVNDNWLSLFFERAR